MFAAQHDSSVRFCLQARIFLCFGALQALEVEEFRALLRDFNQGASFKRNRWSRERLGQTRV